VNVAPLSLAPVEARDVFHVYSTPEGDAAALQGLTLDVTEREVLAVLGPSGSGKSTFLRILAGLERPSAGNVRAFGHELAKLGGRHLAEYRARVLGYVDQHYSRSLDPDLTARTLVGVQLALGGAPRREQLLRADELLERVGLSDRREARPAELSGGEQQRIAVCAALAHRPRLLLADEPTGELDAANAELVYDLMGALAREHGCTTVLVSHDPGSTRIADRTVRIRDGRVSEETAREAGEESIVVGRGGWLRLPEELLLRAGIGSRARAELGGNGIVVSPAEERPPAPNESAPESTAVRGAASTGVVAETRSLSKTYGTGRRATTVLAGLNASFCGGSFTAVTGPSGSGKTTLLHLLAGLSTPTAGDVIAFGQSLPSLSRVQRAALRRARIAIVGQAPELVAFLSALENVELGLALRGVGAAEAEERAIEALHAVRLGDRAEQRVARLSAGERQRVAIARALAVQPELLLADEPTARLDGENALAIGALFARLAQSSGAAIVCASHDPLVVEQADSELRLG
jgi:ABC-type lipoprotein export system ATPase subunit